ncbi:MAG: PD40 domain-containing protein [Candidatus Latescibacteria bacterium]|nr:PD40 domain-containing protein [Candidatus Latescibacterota bacterium]
MFLICVFGLWSFVFNIAHAQYYFNKNKVQYQDFPFKTYETEHFTIYFYDGGEHLLEFTSRYTEEFYARISTDLGFTIKNKIPVVIYNSPNQFSQTNIILDIIEESVGGFAELFKNRVVVPFNGSYKEFRHVIEHEITHIFEFEMFYRSRLASILTSASDFSVPLWIMEGFSEFMSNENETDIGSEIFMRDLVLNNRYIPLEFLSDYMGYVNYRIGEAFFHYVAKTYDRKKVFEFMHTLKNRRSVETAFKNSFGMSVADFNKKFESYLKVKYYPQIVVKDNFAQIGRFLTDHQKDNSIYNASPAISPTGTKIAFISDRNGYSDVYVISAIDGKVLRRLVKGERSAGFEAFQILRGGMSWSSDEKFIVLIAKSRGIDNIVVIEYPSGKIKKRLQYNLDGMYTPSLSPDNKMVCFVGLKNGYADIYIARLDDGELIRVTYDYYDDRDPVFAPDGQKITFVSDRPDLDNWQIGAYALFRASLDFDKGVLNQSNRPAATVNKIEKYPGFERSQYLAKPSYTADTENLVFVAADSSYNIYVYSIPEKRVVRRTNFLGGVYHPSLSQDDNKLAFSYFNNFGWDISVIDEPLIMIPLVETESLYLAQKDYPEYEPYGVEQKKVNPYKFNVSADYAVGQAGYSTYGGFAGQLNVSFSDVLGSHRFYLVTDLYQDIANSDIIFNYWYMPRRTDWALLLFQYFDYPAVYSNYVHIRRNRGFGVLASYPLDKFTRLEFGNINYFSYNEEIVKIIDRRYLWDSYHEQNFVLSQAFVFDNSIWNEWGPFRGTRMRLKSNQSAVLSSRKFYTTYLDLRNYFRLGNRYTFATWLYGLNSFGRDKDQYAIGGEVVRGYEFYEFNDNRGSTIAFTSLELRHPFIDRLKIAFPLPIELRNIRGVTFLDAAAVFNDSTNLYARGEGFKDLKIGIGAGIRIQISYFFLKLDFAKPLSATENKNWKVYFSLGTDF